MALFPLMAGKNIIASTRSVRRTVTPVQPDIKTVSAGPASSGFDDIDAVKDGGDDDTRPSLARQIANPRPDIMTYGQFADVAAMRVVR